MNRFNTILNHIKRLNLIFIIIISFILLPNCGKDNPVDSGTITANPVKLDFSDVKIGNTKLLNVTIENTTASDASLNLTIEGNGKDSYAIIGDANINVPSKKNVTIQLQFTPTTAQLYSATLKIGTKATVNLTGTGIALADIKIQQPALDFGSVKINESKQLSLNIDNLGTSTINLKLAFNNNSEKVFSIQVDSNVTIGKGQSQTVVVEFKPKSEIKYTASLKVDTFAVVQLSGSGISSADITYSPETIAFNEVEIGKSDIHRVTIQNISQNPFYISPSVSGVDANFFKIESYSPKLLDKAKLDSVFISFKPLEARDYNAMLFLDTAKKYSVTLTGKGKAVQPDLEVTPSPVDFGNVQSGNSIQKNISVKNLTSNAISLVTVNIESLTNNFTIKSQPQGTIAPGATDNIVVSFSPTEVIQYQTKLNITTSRNSNFSVNLIGKGTPPSSLNINAVQVSSAPFIDGIDNDASWSSATELNLMLEQVQSTSSDTRKFNAKLKAVHDNQYIYFLVKVQDDSKDEVPNKFVFKGGDPNDDKNWALQTNGQDGIGFIFPVGSNVEGDNANLTFAKYGCQVACHTVSYFGNYEGGMYPGKGTIDLWYWKAGTTNPHGFCDDYYGMGKDGKYPEERRGDLGGNTFDDPNFRPDFSAKPISTASGDNLGLDKSSFIWDDTSTPYSPTVNPATGMPWAANDVVPGWKLRIQSSPFSGRGDIQAKGIYQNGTWIVEFKRLFKTENDSGDDVELMKGATIPFSFAFFDNVRHYAEFEYINLKQLPRPGHFGSNPGMISLKIE